MSTVAAIAEEFSDLPWPEVAIETETFVSDDWEAVMEAMRALEASHVRTRNFGGNGRQPVKGFGQLDALPEGLHITAEQLAERCVVGGPAAVLR